MRSSTCGRISSSRSSPCRCGSSPRCRRSSKRLPPAATAVAREPAAHETVRESVLDRLLDDEPEIRHHDPPPRARDAMARLFQAVRRDLEWLLSTRLTWVDEDLLASEHASRSVAAYGLADFSHEAPAHIDTRSEEHTS